MEAGEGPVGGTDYPRTFSEFNRFFEDAAACREYLAGLRWPGGYHCPRCGSSGAPWIMGRGYLHCRDCGAGPYRGQTTITVSAEPDTVACPILRIPQKSGALVNSSRSL
ncbi:MAG: transposase [Gammaproteobacteria bacterium]